MTLVADAPGRGLVGRRPARSLRRSAAARSTSDSNTVTVQGDVPIAYVMRVNTIGMNPTNGAPTAPGGDLMIREKSSPSAPEHNITSTFTQGNGDASDPEVSYDGKKIVFAMTCPATQHRDARRRQPRPARAAGTSGSTT